MKHHLLVLVFGAQCPYAPWVVEQGRLAAQRLDGVLEVADVSVRPELAARHRMFFPFMTVVDGAARLPSPAGADELVRVAREGLSLPPAAPSTPRPESRAPEVRPLTAANIADTCPLCMRREDLGGCRAKASWAAGMAALVDARVPGGVLGFAAYEGGKAVGAVEYLPAPLVPYPLPEKPADAAFITCVYSAPARLESAPDGLDFRGQVLESLIGHLEGAGLGEVQVVAGRRTASPNGPEPFFLRRGFETVGELDRVTMPREGEEVLVLMRRRLRPAAR